MQMIKIVCGPPGSGKTTYVLSKKKSGDLIIDLDAIIQAFTFLPYYEKPQRLLPLMWDVRDFVVARMKTSQGMFYGGWVIMGGAKVEKRNRIAINLDAKVYVLEISSFECSKRISHDERRKDRALQWVELVNKWWREYEPYELDIIVKQDELDKLYSSMMQTAHIEN